MSHPMVKVPVLKSVLAVAAMTLYPVAQAASVDTIFAVENALYGAGYKVGQADGWLDVDLRSALRQYQSDQSRLTATGELDSDTLASLGIISQDSRLLSGNEVPNRQSAISALGLEEAQQQSKTSKVAESAKPAKPVQRSQPEPAETTQPETVVASAPATKTRKSEPVSKPEPSPEPSAVESDSAPEPVVAQPAPAPEPTREPEPVIQTGSEPTSEPIKIVARDRSEPQPQPRSEEIQQPASDPVESPAVTVAAAEQAEASNPAPAIQATAADNANVSADDAQPQDNKADDNSRGFMSRMFDFLFGWMV